MKETIIQGNLPRHIAVIMDGNGRWAKQKGMLSRIFGHRHAIKAVEEVVEGCAELGIDYLTLYTFSTENWNRPKEEVAALMELLVQAIADQTPKLLKNNIRLLTIGDTESLPPRCQADLRQAMQRTEHNTGLSLVLALSYSGKWDIMRGINNLVRATQSGELASGELTEQDLSNALPTSHIPDVDLMIRTGGEHRISNFLLWQLAYAELHFTETYWPDFRREHLYEAILDFQNRERRFGKTSEQLKA
ncbi:MULTISPECIES: isoprenyl transferase [unclassified Siphonobacter]|uniref:isoprenyl transferase n=1 Tax=unclassified Siphonobacter TaxID=2635712 RepID=UPI000CBBF8CC|nr:MULTISPECIES: isoprenyl transferase [unclassified Siphonobacter]MDQ1089586.1 undecaprenyl diphosphate synthase [Siphonobacter sp. SORGH_AS_1065]MDR6195835.1 undecaprenyl diphosphate synthase [Siphonobacter sp. SORGH_AS_0500]PKK37403.1 isoprenyl transferase [Siphonobacter sp. SORGH_AS_0500]